MTIPLIYFRDIFPSRTIGWLSLQTLKRDNYKAEVDKISHAYSALLLTEGLFVSRFCNERVDGKRIHNLQDVNAQSKPRQPLKFWMEFSMTIVSLLW